MRDASKPSCLQSISKNAAVAISLGMLSVSVQASLPSRHRVVRDVRGASRDNGRAIEGQAYRHAKLSSLNESIMDRTRSEEKKRNNIRTRQNKMEASQFEKDMSGGRIGTGSKANEDVDFERELGSQLTGCCYTYQNYYPDGICGLYGQDCESGDAGSGDNGDEEDCSMEGLSFIGISFSVNSNHGNPYSYQLCDQFPMENIIDRDYDYVMSMDEDGWLVGGGYKTFDYSGKMPYIDSSHTELLRVGSMDPDKGCVTQSSLFSFVLNPYLPTHALSES